MRLRIQKGNARADGSWRRAFWRGLTTDREATLRWRVLGSPAPISVKLWGLSAVTPRCWRVRRQDTLRKKAREVWNLTHEDSARFLLHVHPGKNMGRADIRVTGYTYAAGVGAVSPKSVRAAFPVKGQAKLDVGSIQLGDWFETTIILHDDETEYILRRGETSDSVRVPAITPRPLLFSKAWVYAGGYHGDSAPDDIYLEVEV